MDFNKNQLLYIDVTRLIRRQWQKLMPTGIDRVMLSYVQHYQNTADALFYFLGVFWVIPRTHSKKLYHLLLSSASKRTLITTLIRGVVAGIAQRNKGAARLAQEQQVRRTLLALGHSSLEKKHYIKGIKRLELEPIFFIHDLIPITHPEYCRLGENEKHSRRMINALTVAKGIIVNSQATQEALLEFSAFVQSKAPLMTVAHLGTELLERQSQKDVGRSRQKTINTPYFVVLGTIEPRKNHLLLLHIWQKLIHEMGARAPRLIIIGRRGWECEHVTRMLDRCTSFNGVIFEWSRCSDEQLAACLRGSQALLFPSFVEGYGLPLIEALVAGTPVIASALPAFRELAHNIPEYIDPTDTKQWLSVIADYTNSDSALRAAQLKRLADYKAPSWTNHFSKIDIFLQSIVA
ncbi:glycosyltransferase family 4 protein [Legionella lytica]|uniref:Glycosyltransferase family 4 protein n=1 Tax=Legionella lytica TaxID=96232 RepID=A0ABW8DA82_9GAMM